MRELCALIRAVKEILIIPKYAVKNIFLPDIKRNQKIIDAGRLLDSICAIENSPRSGEYLIMAAMTLLVSSVVIE
jgi:hypothetical protein